MLRHQQKRHRRHQHVEAESTAATAVDPEPRVLAEQPRLGSLPRLAWASVVTDHTPDDRPLSRNKDLLIRPLLDDPRLRRAMGLDLLDPQLVLAAA